MIHLKPLNKMTKKHIYQLKEARLKIYREKLISAVIFGLYSRGDFYIKSDIDLLGL